MNYYYSKDEGGKIVPKSRTDIPGELTGRGGPSCACRCCNEVFSTVDNYEKHRKIVNKSNYRRECVDPSTVGLIIGKHQTWVTEQAWFENDDDDSAS